MRRKDRMTEGGWREVGGRGEMYEGKEAGEEDQDEEEEAG